PTAITTCIAGTGTFVPSAPATLGDLLRGQPMPAETTIEFSASAGKLQGKTDFTVPNTNSQAPACYTMNIGNGDSGDAGVFEVTVTTPGGVETYVSYPINDPDLP